MVGKVEETPGSVAGGEEVAAGRRARYGERRRSLGDWCMLAAAWGIVLLALWPWLSDTSKGQWDLKVYRTAGAAFADGKDPYAPQAALHFVYPPLTLPLFQLLARLPPGVAHYVWLSGKALCLWLGAWVARRHFEPFPHDWRSLAFVLVAFNGAVFTDVRAGNVSLFEQAGLWLAFALLLRAHYWAFVWLIVAIAQFKLVPILFLGMLLIVPERPRIAPFAVGAAVGGLSLLIQFSAMPALFTDFLRHVRELDERGNLNPSSYAAARDFLAMFRRYAKLGPEVTFASYALGVVVTLGVSFRTWWCHRRWLRTHAQWTIVLACCTYALVLPRFKDYAYILLIIPSWMVLRRAVRLDSLPVLLVLVALPLQKSWLPWASHVRVAAQYTPWLALVALFVAVVRHIEQSARMVSRKWWGPSEETPPR